MSCHRKTLIITCLLTAFSLILPLENVSSQIDSLSLINQIEEELIEDLESQTTTDEEGADCTEQLEVLLDNAGKKVNINALAPEVAYTLLGFSDYQYYQLQLYIEMYGELATLYELAAVEGFTRADAERIADRVEARPSCTGRKLFADFFKRSQNSLLFRYGQVLEKQAGYDAASSNPYLGNPARLTFRYTFKSGEHFSLALSGEKDAGEQFFRGAQKQGFDHYAFYLNIKDIGVLRNCVLGDYTLNFGQGLVMGAAGLGGKGGGAAQIRKFPSYLRATAPMNESSNQHGAAVVLGNASCHGTIFYSHRFYDGTLSPTGYHRTTTEVEKRHSLASHLVGGHLQVRQRIFEVGATGTFMMFSHEVAADDKIYRKFAFSGRSVGNAGIDYKVILRKAILFGEAALSVVPKSPVAEGSGKPATGGAFLQGCVWDVDPRSKVSALFRYYGRQYVALNGKGFGTGGGSSGEIGCYIAADFVLGRKTTLLLNADFYRFPWLRYKVDSPSSGSDLGAKVDFSLSRTTAMAWQYRYYRKAQNVRECYYYNSVSARDIHKLKWLTNCNPVSWLKLKTELDYLINRGEEGGLKQGFLICQDVGVFIQKWDFDLRLRVAFFDTDSYDERIYTYEQDVLYTFTINSHYGKGLRYCLVLHYGYSFFDIYAKFAQTFFDDRRTISSGLSQIGCPRKTEIRLQTNFRF